MNSYIVKSQNKCRKIISKLKRAFKIRNGKVEKPWGSYRNLHHESQSCLIKKIIVCPGHQISYQSHMFRNEHWIVLNGQAKVMINDTDYVMNENEHVFVSAGAKHRIKNIGTCELVLIEIQTGEAFREDDILRFEDDYFRV